MSLNISRKPKLSKNSIIFFVVLYTIFFPIKVMAMDLLVNGFGTVCANKSDLPKYSVLPYPVYPFPTLLAPLNLGASPYVVDAVYSPSYVGAARRWGFLGNSKFGLQFTSIFNEKYKAVVQFVGRGETMNNNHFTVHMDWAYLQYNTTNDLDFQFGRFRVPAFYYSDYLDVNHAQPWVRPPEEVYYIVGNAFRNMDGIKARYSYYIDDWTLSGKLWFGNMEDHLNILGQNTYVSVDDVIGAGAQIENDRFSVGGTVMRGIYDSSLYGPIAGIVAITEAFSGGPFPAAQQFNSVLQSNDVPIVYVGLSFAATITDNLDVLVERASILSRGLISTARVGWYGSLTYSFLEKYALTFTYGYSRPLQTETNKYIAAKNFFESPQYLNNIDHNSGAGEAATNLFQSYLGEQRSLGLDARYDILPALSLKGSIKYINPVGQAAMPVEYILNLQRADKHIWVYRFSLDFVF